MEIAKATQVFEQNNFILLHLFFIVQGSHMIKEESPMYWLHQIELKDYVNGYGWCNTASWYDFSLKKNCWVWFVFRPFEALVKLSFDFHV